MASVRQRTDAAARGAQAQCRFRPTKEITMTKNGYWALPLALVGGMAIGTAIAMQRRTVRRLAGRRQRKQELHAWEGEGGSIAPPATMTRRP
jgi:hypothetical protein